MKTLDIGGNRFFGKRLVRLLLEKGHEVTVLNRGYSPFSQEVRHLLADRTEKAALEKAVSGLTFDAIVDQVCFTPKEAAEAIQAFRDKTKYEHHDFHPVGL